MHILTKKATRKQEATQRESQWHELQTKSHVNTVNSPTKYNSPKTFQSIGAYNVHFLIQNK